jgi:hypothetical protein
MITFEIVTALAMVLVLLRQWPGVTSVQYAKKHNQVELQEKRAAAAKMAEKEFGQRHAVANVILNRAGGVLLWGVGLCIVILSAPHIFDTGWPHSAVASFGLAIQLVAAVLYVFWGLIASRTISKAVHAEGSETNR